MAWCDSHTNHINEFAYCELIMVDFTNLYSLMSTKVLTPKSLILFFVQIKILVFVYFFIEIIFLQSDWTFRWLDLCTFLKRKMGLMYNKKMGLRFFLYNKISNWSWRWLSRAWFNASIVFLSVNSPYIKLTRHDFCITL